MAKAERREDALSRERIVDAAIALLDEAGEDGLTFRALATELATGPGAIYWHVENKSELLIAASNAVIARAIGPAEAIHGIATAVFETLDAHPWIGAQLARAPADTAILQIFERLGREVQALGVPAASQFTAASTLMSYIVATSMQNAVNGRLHAPGIDRSRFLESVVARLPAEDYPFTRNVAVEMRSHDDRTEFLAGLDIVLAGIKASYRPKR